MRAVQWHCANVRKHILERKNRKSSRNFSSIVNKQSLVIGCKKSMIRHCVIWELVDSATEQPYNLCKIEFFV